LATNANYLLIHSNYVIFQQTRLVVSCFIVQSKHVVKAFEGYSCRSASRWFLEMCAVWQLM